MIAAPQSKPARIGSSAHSSQADSSDWNRISREGLSLLALCLLLWVLFYSLWRLFPEMTPGSLRVYDAKLAALKEPGFLATPARCKVLVVGLSYTMAGFEPILFDGLGSNKCSSFNLGLPVTIFGRRIYQLDQILDIVEKSGNIPTHVLVTWRDPYPRVEGQTKHSIWNWITPKCDSAQVMQALFPFKQIGRDGPVFFARAFSHGGPAVFGQACDNEVSKMLHNRGYYFMKSDSIYANDELPPDFYARGDSPDQPLARDVKLWEQFVSGLKKRPNGPRILLVPNYYRENKCAPAPSNEPLRDALGKYGVEVIGPDYWKYPNYMFSDAAHLNPTGADVYTKELWNLLKDRLGN